uniref:Uncharacterized protein n=1 Tax=Arundo donax TaxID=35708 RepID=A0A0A9FA39_ARUDO
MLQGRWWMAEISEQLWVKLKVGLDAFIMRMKFVCAYL